jgi:hypothetical protein
MKHGEESKKYVVGSLNGNWELGIVIWRKETEVRSKKREGGGIEKKKP